MNNATLESSPRLQRVLAVLRAAARELSTRDILIEAEVCAVNSCVAELRENGYDIACRQVVIDGRRLWLYRLVGQQRLDLTA